MPAEQKPRTDLTGQGTILLVEDEEGLRSLNARGLRSRGYSVIEASNGVEAMEALEEKNGAVDLVVSDVVMPEMDGPTLLKAMREPQPRSEDHLRLRLRRRRLREEPARKPAIRLPAKTVHAEPAGRRGEGDDDVGVGRRARPPPVMAGLRPGHPSTLLVLFRRAMDPRVRPGSGPGGDEPWGALASPIPATVRRSRRGVRRLHFGAIVPI